VEPDSHRALAEALRSYFSNPTDIERMSARALKRAQDFTAQKHADQILDVYERTIRGYTV
jgi:glycosyltransferase involved in cell wall biosynthesis